MQHEVRVNIHTDDDIDVARQQGRKFATMAGFLKGDPAIIAAVISELTRNILQYAGRGEVTMRESARGSRKGIEIIVADKGPGISDLDSAMKDGFSTSGSLGLGLPGTKRVMDEFEILSQPGKGTKVTIRKWLI